MATLLRICDSCVFYNPDAGVCKAFPDGVPLTIEEGHFEVREDQEGDTIYDMDPDRYEWWDMYRRTNPALRFPILLTYDLPEKDEVMTQTDVEAETV